MNKQIREAIYESLEVTLQQTPEFEEVMERFTEQVVTLKAMGGLKDFENVFWAMATLYGDNMFDNGFALGQKPATVFDLPDSDTAR